MLFIIKRPETEAGFAQYYGLRRETLREPAVGFYEKPDYAVTEKSYLLFDCIQHYRMLKPVK